MMLKPGENRMGFSFAQSVPIAKGWSEDKKYCVTKQDGMNYLLRVSPIQLFDRRKSMFELMKRADQLGIHMCRPIDFGICEEGVYSLQSWIDGQDAEDMIRSFSDKEVYQYGLEAGRILQKIHTIPAPDTQEAWENRFNRKMDFKIKQYQECPLKFDGGEQLVDYINQNRYLLQGRPQCFQHGDYHIGNMMIDQNGKLIIIDFDRFDFGDPREEFNRIVWCAQASPVFASGMIDGYFSGNPPMDFWRLLAMYIASNTLGSVAWAVSFGQGQVDVMMDQMRDVLSWYDGMERAVPAWYTQR